MEENNNINMQENNNINMQENNNNNNNNVKKGSNIKYILLVIALLIIIGLLSVLVYKVYTDKNNGDDTTSSEVTNTGNETNDEIDSAVEQNLLKLVGLTATGYKKEDCSNIANCNADISDVNSGLQTLLFFIDKTGDFTVNDLDNTKIITLLQNYANNNNLITLVEITDDNFTCDGMNFCDDDDENCLEKCRTITPATYSKIAKLYNITKDGKSVFNVDSEQFIYKGNYYFTTWGSTIHPANITDSVKFTNNKDSVILEYKAVIKEVDVDNPRQRNATYTYTFKKDSSNNYYLDKINIKNN